MGTHSKISPSHSKRWMNCPGSIVLAEKCPAQEQSKYAAEGTVAHEVASLCLSLERDADEYIGEMMESGDFTFKVTQDMAEHVQVYLDTIREDMAADGVPIEFLKVEQKFTLYNIDKKLYGTNDASYMNPFGMLRVYDLKYGKGMYVEVESNTQLLIYDLGAWQEQGEPYNTEIVIVQPRYVSEGVDTVRRATYNSIQLKDFRRELRSAVDRINNGELTQNPGEWCTFCPGMALCNAKKKEVLSVLPTEINLPEPAMMSVNQMTKVMAIADRIAEWASSIHKHAESLAKTGVTIPGYKLIKKRANRRWIDEMAVETEFEAEYGDDIYTKKLKSPAQLEKVAGKEAVADYTEVPDNGVQLVSEKAKSKAVKSGAEQAFTKLN